MEKRGRGRKGSNKVTSLMHNQYTYPARAARRHEAPQLPYILSLVRRLGSSDGPTRVGARTELVEMGEPAVGALMLLLALGHDQERWEAAKALTQMNRHSGAPALVCALEDTNFGVRWLAAEGLIRLGRKGLPALLWALVHHPESWWLKEGAHHVLFVLAKRKTNAPIAGVLRALDGLTSPAHAALTALAEMGELQKR